MKLYDLPTLYLECFLTTSLGLHMHCIDGAYDVLLDIIDHYELLEENLPADLCEKQDIKTFAECFSFMKGRIKDKYAETLEEYFQTEFKLIKRAKVKHLLKKYNKLIMNCDIFEKGFNKTFNVNLEEINAVVEEENRIREQESDCE